MTRARTIDEWLDEYCVSRHSLDARRRLAAVAGIRREAIADFLASPRAGQRLARCPYREVHDLEAGHLLAAFWDSEQ